MIVVYKYIRERSAIQAEAKADTRTDGYNLAVYSYSGFQNISNSERNENL